MRRPFSTEFAFGHVAAIEFGDDAPFIHDQDAVGQREDFVELAGNEQHARAFVARADDALMDEFNRADIHAACRLGGDQNLWLPLKFARHNELLLVAAAELSGGRAERAGPHVIFLDRLRGAFAR